MTSFFETAQQDAREILAEYDEFNDEIVELLDADYDSSLFADLDVIEAQFINHHSQHLKDDAERIII